MARIGLERAAGVGKAVADDTCDRRMARKWKRKWRVRRDSGGGRGAFDNEGLYRWVAPIGIGHFVALRGIGHQDRKCVGPYG